MTTILLIDDQAHFREGIRCFLEDLDYTIIEAENGRLGLQKITDEKPDLVLMDLSMPEMGGLELLAELSKDNIIDSMPVIVISGNGMMGDVVEALRLKAWDYIVKPISDCIILEHAVTKVLQRSELIKKNLLYHEHLEDEIVKQIFELQDTNAQLNIEKERAQVASNCKSKFLSNINHKFRTPLNSIFDYAKFIKDRADKSDEDHIKDVNKIIGLSERMLSMITGIMDLIEFDNTKLKFEWVDINHLMNLVMDALKNKLTCSNIVIQALDASEKIHTDKVILVQALVRIIENGAKFSNDKLVHIFVEKNETQYLFKVQDQGIGIPENELDKIFDPLYQVDESSTRAHDGAGIGLAVVNHYVNLLDGEIDVVSQVNEGSSFTVKVPIQ